MMQLDLPQPVLVIDTLIMAAESCNTVSFFVQTQDKYVSCSIGAFAFDR